MGQLGDDRLSLPVPPPPNPAARREAIDAALRKFDGIEDSPAPRHRRSLYGWATTHRSLAGGLVTAALIAVISIPAIQIALRDRPAEVASDVSLPEVRNEPPAESMVTAPTSPAQAQAPAAPQQPATDVEAVAEPSAIAAKSGGFAPSAREERAKVAPPLNEAPAPAPMIAPPPPPQAPSAGRRAPSEPEAQQQAADAANDVGNIVVTGSRAKQSNLESAVPVTVINAPTDFLSRLKDALADNDRRAVIRMIGFPLRVSFAGATRTYRTRQDVERDYDRIFTSRVRASVLNTGSDELLARDGGRLRGNGSIWFGCGLRQCSSDEAIRIREVRP